ncbi:MAG: DUF4367 domain-containing protein [Firmicutes bacterium]|nr:DUF4367 domain-containing protein [Bacillota bacterium]
MTENMKNSGWKDNVININDKINERLKEKRADEFMKILAEYAARQEEERCERLFRESSSAELPEGLEKRLYDTADRFAEKEKRRTRRFSAKGLSKVCAVILIAFVSVGSVTMLSVKAWRMSNYDMVTGHYAKDMDLSFKEVREDGADRETETAEKKSPDNKIKIYTELPEDLDRVLYPGYMKDGYGLKQASEFAGVTFVFYGTEKEQFIIFDYMDIDTVTRVDTEYSDNIEVEVNEQEALLQKNGDSYYLYWPYDNYKLMLSCNNEICTQEELIKIAESIAWYDRELFEVEQQN